MISLEPLYTRLAGLGFSEFEEEGLLIHDFPVQFLSASPGLETEAVREALALEWENHRVRVIRAEHLAAIALSTGRPKDRARLVYLAELPSFERPRFQIILDRHNLAERWTEWGTALGLLQPQLAHDARYERRDDGAVVPRDQCVGRQRARSAPSISAFLPS